MRTYIEGEREEGERDWRGMWFIEEEEEEEEEEDKEEEEDEEDEEEVEEGGEAACAGEGTEEAINATKRKEALNHSIKGAPGSVRLGEKDRLTEKSEALFVLRARTLC